MNAKLTQAQITLFIALRSLPTTQANEARAELFDTVKGLFGIPADHKLKVELDNPGSPLFGVLIRKKTGSTYRLDENGQWDGGSSTPFAPSVAPSIRYVLTGDQVRTAVLAAINNGTITPLGRGPSHDVLNEMIAQSYGDVGEGDVTAHGTAEWDYVEYDLLLTVAA